MLKFISSKAGLGLLLSGLLLSLTLAACGDTTTPTSGAAVTSGATVGATASNALAQLKTQNQNLTDTAEALKKGDLAGAKTAYKKFDDNWVEVETIIKNRSTDAYKAVEDAMTPVGRELLRTDSPVAATVLPLLATLQQKYDSGVSLVEKASQSGASAPKVATISGPEVDTATARISDYLKGKADSLVGSTADFATVVKARDLAKAKTAYQTARFDYESIEFLAGSFKELDLTIDGRPNNFPQGENDPKWTGFHALEKAIFVDGKLDERTDRLADALGQDVSGLRDEIKKLTITPTMALSGAAELLEEIQSGKITGEEERYSHTDLNDFKANLQSARTVYEAYAPFVKQRNATLADELQTNFGGVETSIVGFFPDGKALEYTRLDDKTRKVVAQKMEALATSFSRVSGTLGLQAQG